MNVTLRVIARSDKSAHQLVQSGDATVGEVWCEQVSIVVSKLTEPRRMGTKWRWFARQTGNSATLGRGTRAATLLGPYPSAEPVLTVSRG
jgi:hypothetical protein